jgi:hypothetical protein
MCFEPPKRKSKVKSILPGKAALNKFGQRLSRQRVYFAAQVQGIDSPTNISGMKLDALSCFTRASALSVCHGNVHPGGPTSVLGNLLFTFSEKNAHTIQRTSF